MTTYRITRSALIFIYGLLGFVTLMGVIAVYLGLWGSPDLFPDQPFMILLLGIMVWIWVVYARIPLTISWQNDQILEFKSLLATTPVPVHNIIAVKATPLSWGFIKLTYQGGSLRLLCQITGLYELLTTVKNLNPGVEITGC
jgi:hypothetical protein